MAGAPAARGRGPDLNPPAERSSSGPRPFRLLAISQRSALPLPHPAGAFTAWCRALAAAGVDALQVREKDLADGPLLDLAERARAAFPAPGKLLVNGRLDVALAAAADGAHLPGDGVPVAALRRRFGAARLLGVSTHSLAEVESARRAGADFVVFGPVWATPDKGGPGTATAPAGTAALARAAAAGLPVYALGGVTIERFAEAAAAGAAGIAAIRLFQPIARLEEVVTAAVLHFP